MQLLDDDEDDVFDKDKSGDISDEEIRLQVKTALLAFWRNLLKQISSKHRRDKRETYTERQN